MKRTDKLRTGAIKLRASAGTHTDHERRLPPVAYTDHMQAGARQQTATGTELTCKLVHEKYRQIANGRNKTNCEQAL